MLMNQQQNHIAVFINCLLMFINALLMLNTWLHAVITKCYQIWRVQMQKPLNAI